MLVGSSMEIMLVMAIHNCWLRREVGAMPLTLVTWRYFSKQLILVCLNDAIEKLLFFGLSHNIET